MEGKIAGQDESARKEDAKGYKTTTDMLTGGVHKDIGGDLGPEVMAPNGDSLTGKKNS